MVQAHINRIGTALPPHDVHQAFISFVGDLIEDRRDAALFRRMESRAGIAHRWSFVEPVETADRHVIDKQGFYTPGAFPSTAARLARYEELAPGLACEAIDALDLDSDARAGITHLVVASCTGFVAPGLDQRIVELAGLSPGMERTVVGFMGCYAAVNALRLAHHFVRSEPDARVLVVCLELCTLHFQQTTELERLLAMLLFGDGCAAALVTGEAKGLALKDFRAVNIADSAGAIEWRIGDQGFDMHLSGEVPGRIQRALAADMVRNDEGGLLRGTRPEDYRHWAVHAGGRSILDAVEAGLGLAGDALDGSRKVLNDNGNMSSATLMFVLRDILGKEAGAGMAMAFGPGLAAESFRFQAL